MNRKTTGLVMGVLLVLVLSGACCYKGDKSGSSKKWGCGSRIKGCSAIGVQGKEGTIRGEIICSGCYLKEKYGAGAQCSIYGHDYSLKVIECSAGGKKCNCGKGECIHKILPNDRSKELLSEKNRGKEVSIEGKIYPGSRLVEVNSYKIKTGSEWEAYNWCGKCRVMVEDTHKH